MHGGRYSFNQGVQRHDAGRSTCKDQLLGGSQPPQDARRLGNDYRIAAHGARFSYRIDDTQEHLLTRFPISQYPRELVYLFLGEASWGIRTDAD